MPSIVVETASMLRSKPVSIWRATVDAHVQSSAFTGERVVEPGETARSPRDGRPRLLRGTSPRGIRQRLSARITEMERPRRFVDEMVRGAFLSLRHVHEFTATAGGGTRIVATVTWKSPFGLLGYVADAVVLKRHMRWFITRSRCC
jgi:hypothetical protein